MNQACEQCGRYDYSANIGTTAVETNDLRMRRSMCRACDTAFEHLVRSHFKIPDNPSNLDGKWVGGTLHHRGRQQ